MADIQVMGKGFGVSGSRFDWRGISAFMLIYDARGFPDQRDIMLDFCQFSHFTVPRIWMTVDAGYIAAFDEIGGSGQPMHPAVEPNFWTYVIDTVKRCNARGLTPEIVMFGAAGPMTTEFATQAARLAFTEETAKRLKPYRNLFLQIANEWNQIGFTDADVLECARTYRALDPTRMLTISPPNGGGDTSTVPFVAPASYFTVHVDRGDDRTDLVTWWVTRRFYLNVFMQGQVPVIDDEPINAGPPKDHGANDENFDNWYTWALLTRFMQWHGTVHYEEALWGPRPWDATWSCVMAAMEGWGDWPYDSPGTFFASGPSGPVMGDPPWATSGSAMFVAGKHNGANGLAIFVQPSSGAFTPPTVGTGWTAILHKSKPWVKVYRIFKPL